MSSLPSRSDILSGPELTMNSKSPGAKIIRQPLGRWLTNGSASSGAVGKPTRPTTRSTTWRACEKKAHPCSLSPPPNQKLLDSSPSDGLFGATELQDSGFILALFLSVRTAADDQKEHAEGDIYCSRFFAEQRDEEEDQGNNKRKPRNYSICHCNLISITITEKRRTAEKL